MGKKVGGKTIDRFFFFFRAPPPPFPPPLHHPSLSLTHLQTVHRQPAPRFGRARLQIGNDRVVHILLLLPQKVGRHRVERVRRQLVVALDGGQHVQLDAPLNRDLLHFARAVGFGRECRVAHAHARPRDAAKHGEVGHAQRFRALQQVGQVKVGGVVADDDVGVGFDDQVAPAAQQRRFVLERHDFGARDGGARVQRQNVAHDGGRGGPDDGHHGRDLNDRVARRVGKVALAPRALDVDRQNAQRGEAGKVAFGGVGDDVGVVDVDFDL